MTAFLVQTKWRNALSYSRITVKDNRTTFSFRRDVSCAEGPFGSRTFEGWSQRHLMAFLLPRRATLVSCLLQSLGYFSRLTPQPASAITWRAMECRASQTCTCGRRR